MDGFVSDRETTEYFDHAASGWARQYISRPNFRTRLEIVLEWLRDLPRGRDILDYGCGSGVMLRALADAGHKVTGVDASESMLGSARQLLEAGAIPPDRFTLELVGADYRGRFLDRRYDAIVCTGVLEYLSDPCALLGLLGDRLRAGGRLVVSFPNRLSLLRRAEWLALRCASMAGGTAIGAFATTRYGYLRFQKSRPALAEIIRALNATGLELARVRYSAARGWLTRLERYPVVGMTTMAEFRAHSRLLNGVGCGGLEQTQNANGVKISATVARKRRFG